jgi:hypothetical protein
MGVILSSELPDDEKDYTNIHQKIIAIFMNQQP